METTVSASEQKEHDLLEILKKEKGILVHALDFLSKSKNEQCAPNYLLQRCGIMIDLEFDILIYLKRCHNVINLAFGRIPRDRVFRRKLHRNDEDPEQDSRSDHVIWKEYVSCVDKDFTYILAHARSFEDQTKNMCMLKLENYVMSKLRMSICNTVKDTNMFRMQRTEFDFLCKIDDMIESLGKRYDEAKYMVLNANMTYLILVILRLSVQGEMEFSNCFTHGKTHEDYRKLCPHPLGSQLPRLNKYFITHITDSLRLSLSLVIHTYLNVKDEITKTILEVTCINYVKWFEMELPMLFNKVVDLYGLESGRLWDLLSFEKTSDSLIKLAKFYNNMYKQYVTKPDSNDYIWMPYKIATEGKSLYYLKLSASDNVYLCTILACIVDAKLDTKMYLRNSEWATDRTAMKTGLKIAKAFQQFYSYK